MRILLTTMLILFFNSQIIHSQTKLIAHKSHSGKASDFHKAMTKPTLDLVSSNFGEAPSPFVRYAKLDTLRYISDTIVIMKTSNYCENKYTDSTKLWSAGIDTIYNHPLFSKKDGLDSIKLEIKDNYYFKNPVDSIVFIGYESIKKIDNENKQKENSLAFFIDENIKPPFNPKFIGIIISLILALIIGFAYRRINSNDKSFKKI